MGLKINVNFNKKHQISFRYIKNLASIHFLEVFFIIGNLVFNLIL